jgi:2-aminoethylphosphonate-pyruvate transaminase
VRENIDTAVILAAGTGTRLGESGTSRPKGFLRLGERPIVEESVLRLRASGIGRVVIVTGHRAEFYAVLRDRYRELISTVHNPRYADSGSMYSLYLARRELNAGFLLLESDLIYESRALRETLDFARSDVVLLSGPTGAGDEVFVEAPGGRLRSMSKRSDVLRSVEGELVGICKISVGLYAAMCENAEKRFADTLHLSYETDTLVAVARDHDVRCHRVDDLDWLEIDDPDHLRRARERVYPRILANDPLPPD